MTAGTVVDSTRARDSAATGGSSLSSTLRAGVFKYVISSILVVVAVVDTGR